MRRWMAYWLGLRMVVRGLAGVTRVRRYCCSVMHHVHTRVIQVKTVSFIRIGLVSIILGMHWIPIWGMVVSMHAIILVMPGSSHLGWSEVHGSHRL